MERDFLAMKGSKERSRKAQGSWQIVVEYLMDGEITITTWK
jgi:hypothetical protein